MKNSELITFLVGIVTIVAMILSPIIALSVQRKIDSHGKREEIKKEVFVKLLSTRARTSRLYVDHVTALNIIDVVFYEEKNIIESWAVYRDHLNSKSDEDDCSRRIWFDKCDDYFVDLLYVMSKYFQYNFDKVLLKKGAYLPVAHGDYQKNMSSVVKGLSSIISGDKTINVTIKK